VGELGDGGKGGTGHEKPKTGRGRDEKNHKMISRGGIPEKRSEKVGHLKIPVGYPGKKSRRQLRRPGGLEARNRSGGRSGRGEGRKKKKKAKGALGRAVEG